MNPSDIKRFHNDLKAAIGVGVPIELNDDQATASGRPLTSARVSQLESLITPRLTGNGNTAVKLKQAFGSQSEFPCRYQAALQTFAHTGSMVPVLEGLSTRKFAQQQVSKILRWAFTYLSLLLIVASAGLILFSLKIVPVINDFRADLLLPAAIQSQQRFDVIPWLSTIEMVLGSGLVLLLIWILAGGSSKLAMWMGGRRYVQSRISTTVLRTIEMLVSTGVPVAEAVKIGCDLAGADTRVRREVQSAAQDPQNAQHLGSMANYLAMSGNQRIAYMKVATPIALVCTLGGGVALLYCLTIFWPIISLLKDLPTAGIK